MSPVSTTADVAARGTDFPPDAIGRMEQLQQLLNSEIQHGVVATAVERQAD